MKLAAMLLSASLLVPVAAQTAAAQSRHAAAPQTYEECVRQQRNRQVAGAVIGGILGAVVGAEIHDDRQDRKYENRRYGRHGHYRGGRHYRGRHYRGRHHHRLGYGYRDPRYEDGNDGAVAVGGLLGATAGAAVAGNARGCERFTRGGYGYDDPGYDREYGYRGRRYDDRYSGADYGYSDGYDPYDGRHYSTDTLAGAPNDAYAYRDDGYDAPAPSRRSSAQARVYTAGGGSSCRWMSAGANGEVRMCQGADGIWRPAD